MTKQQLQEQLKSSMLARNELKTSVLRMLLSAVTYYEINKGGAGYSATEEDVLTVTQNQVKQRRDSIEQFEAANRMELAQKEKNELIILQEFLPTQMPEEEVKALVEKAVENSGAKSISEMGKVMALLMPSIKGKADGSMVSKFVKEALSN